MKAFILDKYKGKDGGRIGQIPVPQPRVDEVLGEYKLLVSTILITDGLFVCYVYDLFPSLF